MSDFYFLTDSDTPECKAAYASYVGEDYWSKKLHDSHLDNLQDVPTHSWMEKKVFLKHSHFYCIISYANKTLIIRNLRISITYLSSIFFTLTSFQPYVSLYSTGILKFSGLPRSRPLKNLNNCKQMNSLSSSP